MKKLYILGLAAILALSLLLAGCGNTSKTETPQTNKQSQDMTDPAHDMNSMDHSKMNMNSK